MQPQTVYGPSLNIKYACAHCPFPQSAFIRIVYIPTDSERLRYTQACACSRTIPHMCTYTMYPLPRCTIYYTAYHNPPKYTINPQWDGSKVTAVQGHKLSHRQLEA